MPLLYCPARPGQTIDRVACDLSEERKDSAPARRAAPRTRPLACRGKAQIFAKNCVRASDDHREPVSPAGPLASDTRTRVQASTQGHHTRHNEAPSACKWLMLDRFDRERNPDAGAYRRFGWCQASRCLTPKRATSVESAGRTCCSQMNFGAGRSGASTTIAMLNVVRGWREFFTQQGVEQRSIQMLEQAMLPPSFFRDTPPDAV